LPILNDIRKVGTHKQIYIACIDCGKERWVWIKNGKPQSLRCRGCNRNSQNGNGSPTWKTGRHKHNGYVYIWIAPKDFFHPMANCRNYITEHRLVMAKHLGRNLQQWEVIHHKNGIRDDNRIENLQLVSELGHKQISMYEKNLSTLEKDNERLKAKVEALESRILILETK